MASSRVITGPPGYSRRSAALLFARFLFGEVERRRVHAETQARRIGTVVEDVAEMRSAAAAHHFRSHHSVAAIGFLDDFALIEWSVKAWPSATRIVFGIGGEQLVPA